MFLQVGPMKPEPLAHARSNHCCQLLFCNVKQYAKIRFYLVDVIFPSWKIVLYYLAQCRITKQFSYFVFQKQTIGATELRMRGRWRVVVFQSDQKTG